MFDEVKKYKNNGHFFFKKGADLKQVSKDVPDLPGVYCIVRLSNGRIEIVYIGKSGTMQQNGHLKDQGLHERLHQHLPSVSMFDFQSMITRTMAQSCSFLWYILFGHLH